MQKAPNAYRTISEVAELLDLPQHVLRFWETRFSQIRPVKRAGGRRYYRPNDIMLLRGIRHLLYEEGYTIKGVQRILRECGIRSVMQAPLAGDPGHTDAAPGDATSVDDASGGEPPTTTLLPAGAENGAPDDPPQLHLDLGHSALQENGDGSEPLNTGKARPENAATGTKKPQGLRLMNRFLGDRGGHRAKPKKKAKAQDDDALREVLGELLDCKRMLDRQVE